MKTKKLKILIVTLIIACSFGNVNVVGSESNENLVSIETETNMWSFNSSWDTWVCNNYSTGNAISDAYVNSTIGYIYGQPKMNETGGGQAEGWMRHSVEWDCPVDNESGVINISYEYGAFAFLRVNSSGYAHAKLWLTFFIDDMQHEVIIYNNTIDQINESVNFSAGSIENWSKNLTLSNKTYTIGVNASYEIEYTGNDTQSIAWLSINIPDTTTEEGDGNTEYWAVLIGVDYTWHQPTATHIRFDEMAEEMHKMLLISDHWQEDHMKVLTEKEATWVNIIDALLWLDSMDDGDDISLVYYAAHGGNLHNYTIFGHNFGDIDLPPIDEDDGYDEFLTTYWSGKRFLTSMTDDLFNYLLDRLDSEGVAVIIDACYSGGMIDENASTWITKFSGEINHEGRVIVTCSGEHESGYIDNRNGLSFTYFIAAGLQGNADEDEWGNGNGVVSIEEAFKYAKPKYENLPQVDCHPVIYDPDEFEEIELTDAELPPSKPILYGNDVTIGQLCTSYVFNASSTDPENNNITYGWNWSKDRSFDSNFYCDFFWGWGGYDVENWSVYYSSGDNCTMSHSWNEPGIYAVRVKGKDEYGAERIENLEYSGLWSKPKYLLINAEDEIVDQYQIKANDFNQLGAYPIVQTFIPNSSYLSKIKLKLGLTQNYEAWSEEPEFKEYPLNVSIRDKLTGENLAFASKLVSKELKEINSRVDWVEFDFTNINVTPNKTYYIVLEDDTNYMIYRWLYYDNGDYTYCFITYEPWAVDAGGPYYALLDEQPVQFNGSAFGNPPYDWLWDFGDGNTSEERNPAHTYESIGNYTVKLTVTDSENVTANDTTWANIRDYNNPPYAPNKPSGPTICKVGKYYDYSTYTTDSDGDPMYYKWDWGDGTYSDWLGPYNSGQTLVTYHKWSQWGLYKVRVKAKDVYGGESGWSDKLWVWVRLLSGFSISPSSYSQASQTVYFNDMSKSYYNIVSWTWNFGDGNFAYTQDTSHTYAADGVYTVTLTVTDSMSASNVSSQLVYIDSVQPGITSITDTPDTTVGFNSDVVIDASVFDDLSGINAVRINITYPDGSYQNFTMSKAGSAYEYVFSDTWLVGQYNYTIYVFDKSNNSNSSSGHSFTVSSQATISIATLKDRYGDNEYINITDPPTPPDDYYIVDRGLTWNEYYNATSGNNVLEVYSGPVNYQDENGSWTPIECNITLLDSSHPAYSYGYRAGNEHGLYHVYFKPNAQNSWPIAFAYNKSSDPETHVIRSKLVGVGYLDPSQGWAYEYLQSVQSSQGAINGSSAVYEDVFTGTDVVWTYGNSGLKEEIIMSNATKTVFQDHPPSEYGLSNQNSYLVFITKLDYLNLNLYNSSGMLTGNFTTSDERIDFKDALEHFKCALPIGEAYEMYNESAWHKLVYRVLQYNGNYYLLSGLKVVDLNNMTFPVVIDPTLTVDSIFSDGHIMNDGTQCASVHDAASGSVLDGASTFSIGQDYDPFGLPPYTIWRGFVFFDTSSIPSNMVITSATLSLYKDTDFSPTDFDIVVQNGQPMYPHDPLQNGDYNKNHYSGDGGSLNTADFSAGYNDISLTNYSWIKTDGTTKLCLRSRRDIDSNAPAGSEYVTVCSSDYPTAGHSPKLVVEYKNQSKIKNTGSTDIKGYLLMQVQYDDVGQWVVDHDTVNETTPRTITSQSQLALDTIFNGLVKTSDLSHGYGMYRVYAAFRDPDGDVLVTDDKTVLEAWYVFEVAPI